MPQMSGLLLLQMGMCMLMPSGCACMLQACLREGMRVFPPVPTLTREAERDMDLGGYRVQKGEMIGVAVFSMHNNPKYWKACVCPQGNTLGPKMP